MRAGFYNYLDRSNSWDVYPTREIRDLLAR